MTLGTLLARLPCPLPQYCLDYQSFIAQKCRTQTSCYPLAHHKRWQDDGLWFKVWEEIETWVWSQNIYRQGGNKKLIVTILMHRLHVGSLWYFDFSKIKLSKIIIAIMCSSQVDAWRQNKPRQFRSHHQKCAALGPFQLYCTRFYCSNVYIQNAIIYCESIRQWILQMPSTRISRHTSKQSNPKGKLHLPPSQWFMCASVPLFWPNPEATIVPLAFPPFALQTALRRRWRCCWRRTAQGPATCGKARLPNWCSRNICPFFRDKFSYSL